MKTDSQKEEMLQWLNFCVDESSKNMEKCRAQLKFLDYIAVVLAVAVLPLYLKLGNMPLAIVILIVMIIIHSAINKKLCMSLSVYSTNFLFSKKDINEINGQGKDEYKDFMHSSITEVEK